MSHGKSRWPLGGLSPPSGHLSLTVQAAYDVWVVDERPGYFIKLVLCSNLPVLQSVAVKQQLQVSSSQTVCGTLTCELQTFDL